MKTGHTTLLVPFLQEIRELGKAFFRQGTEAGLPERGLGELPQSIRLPR